MHFVVHCQKDKFLFTAVQFERDRIVVVKMIMRRIFVLFLSAQIAATAFAQNSGQTDKTVEYRNVIYTTNGDLLLREVTNTKADWFLFEECELVPSNQPALHDHAAGACYALSPKYKNSAVARYALSERFTHYLARDLSDIKIVQNFSRWLMPLLTAWSINRGFSAWNKFYYAASTVVRFRSGVVAITLSVLSTLMAAIILDAWTSQIPPLEVNLKVNNLRAEDAMHGSFTGQDVYLLFRTALRQAFADKTVLQYEKAPGFN